MRKLLSHLILCLFFFNAGFCQTTNGILERPADLKDGIQTSTPATEGMNAAVINDIVKAIDSGFYPNRHGLLIYKNGKLVLEKYFTGRDQKAWAGDIGVVEHNVNTLHDMRSVSKSVVSACIGIAIAQGKIKSVHQKIFTFFPEYEAFDTGTKKDLTIEHLLTMSSGLQWNEDIPYSNPENSEMLMTASKDPLAYIFSQPMAAAPGTVWKYNGGTTQLLAEILRRATGKTADEFANENIFKKLAIADYYWALFPGTKNPIAASGLRLRPRDMLKFGILYQYGGKWQGQQIIPRSWVEQSLLSKVARPETHYSAGGYGYQFWIFKDSIQGKAMEWPAAVGNGDQRIFFDRKNDLVVVMTAGNYNKWDIKNNAYAILKKIYESFPMK
ncbi:MAG: penicillin-binding protein beta-lactamase class [Chitinophagaceae bacterium]|nr:penicillin-binding protein beta-lactamase class [Chitinophagaceae bacterium]